MPFLNGYEASIQIRRLIEEHSFEQPKIVACTGHVENEYIEKAWRHQMDEVLPKPVSQAILQEILNEIIQVD